MNQKALRGKMVVKGFNQKQLAKELHISENTFSNKMKNGSFTIAQVDRICEILEICTPAEKCDIFLPSISQ